MGTVKTTINVDEDLWRKFSILVIQEKGYRKKTDVIESLIKKYVDDKEKR
jgi:metal-responsive CopG/Arc/MetJ family transcriptional regulator